ncbi:MAG TPA: hypothetical protein VKD70_13715 [Candidatus Acidoferrum sp.]|nr:hypothetical protein [Candidatus Acidoferrum sp.]
MKRIYLAVIASLLPALGAGAQTQTGAQANAQAGAEANVGNNQAQASGGASATTTASAQDNGSNAMIADGTAINAALNSSIDSKKAKQGDEVTAHTTEAVKSQGKTIVPKGCKLVGHVTRASARGKGDAESALGIAFDKAILKNGREIPLNGSIQALASGESAASVPGADADAMAGAGASGGGRATSGGRGALGGVGSTAGSAVGGVTNTAGSVASTAGGAVDTTARTAAGTAGAANGAVGGLTATGQFATNSRGVFGLDGLNLNAASSNNAEGSVITSAGKNVHLDSGTRMLIVSGAQAGGAKPAAEGAQKPQPNSKKQTNQ